MKPLPIDPVAAAEFILRRLYRRLPVGGAEYFAVGETEHPFAGDDWCWTDDNAKIVEFLAHPSLRRRYAKETTAIVGFLRAMCRGPLIFRRVSAPEWRGFSLSTIIPSARTDPARPCT